jgi:hypothetical protein
VINHPKKLAIFLLASSLIGCSKSGDSARSAMDDFKKDKPFSKDGGASLSNGDFVKYTIAADHVEAAAQIEISSRGQCYRVTGTIPIALIEGNDDAGQFWQAGDLRVQINPKENDRLQYNQRFVHFIVDRKDGNKVPCSDAPKEIVSDGELSTKMQKTFFSDLPLSARQQQMAGPVLARGASTFMLFFKNQKIGLLFDSATNDLVGVDVPKQILESDYLFTSGRQFLQIDSVSEDDLFPLILTADDMAIHHHSIEMANLVKRAVANMNNKTPADRDSIIAGLWAELFRK